MLECEYTVYKWVGILFMPLFFFVSGCLSKDDITPRQLVNRLVGRLLIPYFVWGIIMQICINNAFIHASINGNQKVIHKNISDIVMGDFLWYVPCLVCIECMNFVIMKLCKLLHDRWLVRVLVMLSSFAYLMMMGRGHLPWHLDTAYAAIGFYLMGYFYFKYGKHVKSMLVAILATCAFFAVALYERQKGVVFDIHQHILSHPLLILVSAVAGVFVSINLCCNINMGRMMSVVGTNSLFIYIFHYKVLCMLKPIVNKIMTMTDNEISIVMIPLMVVISISVCNLLIKPINKYALIIIGNKKINL